jgi:CHAD domain-containing protein
MVDALSPLLAAVTDEYREAMRGYQAMMGEIQDLKVLLAALDKFIEAEDHDPATHRLRAEFVRRREQLIRVYINSADQLQLFWPLKDLSPQPTTSKYKEP